MVDLSICNNHFNLYPRLNANRSNVVINLGRTAQVNDLHLEMLPCLDPSPPNFLMVILSLGRHPSQSFHLKVLFLCTSGPVMHTSRDFYIVDGLGDSNSVNCLPLIPPVFPASLRAMTAPRLQHDFLSKKEKW